MRKTFGTKKSFIIIGLGRFGSSIAKILEELNCDVLAVDISEDSVSAIAPFVSHCVVADSTKPAVLEELGAKNIDHAVVAIGNNLQASILTVLNLKNLGVPSITVRADSEGHKEVFTALGATEVIIPEEASAISLANQIMSDSILDYYPLSSDYSMVKISVGDGFEPKSIVELKVRVLFDVNIVGIIKNTIFTIPKATDMICPGDILVVVGTKDKYTKFDHFLNEKSTTAYLHALEAKLHAKEDKLKKKKSKKGEEKSADVQVAPTRVEVEDSDTKIKKEESEETQSE